MRHKVQVEIPVELAEILEPLHQNLDARVGEALAVALFRRETISSGKAAEILGIPRTEFWKVLDRYNVPRVYLSRAELDADIETMLRVGDRQRP